MSSQAPPPQATSGGRPHQLSFDEFMKSRGLQIEELSVDKFWERIDDNDWIYVGEDMLTWIGYSTNLRNAKKQFLQLVSSHFDAGVEYKILSASELKSARADNSIRVELPANFNQHNKVNHLIVSPDCFKSSMMVVQTPRAKEIRQYYRSVERVMGPYMAYCFKLGQGIFSKPSSD